MTLRKVAELAGVSRTTVSLVVNNVEGSRVSVKTRQRVLKAVRKLAYKPHPIAQRLSLRKANAIGLLIPFSSPLFSNSTNVEIIGGVQEAANEKGVDLVLFSGGKHYLDPDGEAIVGLLGQSAVDGIIIANTRFSTHRFVDTVVRCMKQRDRPAVLLEYYWGSEDVNYVGADYDDGIFRSICRLIRLGHQAIGLITPPPEAPITPRMVACYKKAVERHNLSAGNRLIGTADYSAAKTRQVTKRLINEHPDMTAIFVGDYEMALSCVKTVKEAGLNVPGDLSIISFADHEVFPHLDPSLTAVRIPYYEMGKMAADLILDDSRKRKQIILPTDLVVRDSTAAVDAIV
jgi:LacI family transcriptional regulator